MIYGMNYATMGAARQSADSAAESVLHVLHFERKEKVMSEYINPSLVPKFRLSDGHLLPCVGLGTFGSDHVSPDDVARAVDGAIRSGYRMIDCASVYGNEDKIGPVLEQLFSEGVLKREELTVTSKMWNDMHGQGDVLLSCAKSLRDLKLDYLDIYFVHWPFPNYHAPFCDGDSRNPDSKPFSVNEFMNTWRQVERLVDMGLVKYPGVSNMTKAKMEAILPLCRIKPSVAEFELHPCFQQPELFDYMRAHDILPVGYCPVGSPNRPERDTTPEDVSDTKVPELVSIAERHGIHPAQVCIKWAVQRGQLPIPFSVNHYAENLKCVTEDPLTDEEMKILKTVDRNCRLIKGQVFLWPGAESWHDLWDEDGTIIGGGK